MLRPVGPPSLAKGHAEFAYQDDYGAWDERSAWKYIWLCRG